MEAVQNGHPPLRTRKDRLRSEGKNLRIQPRTPRRRPQKPRSMKTNNGALKRSREDVKEAIEVSFDFGVPYVVTLKKGGVWQNYVHITRTRIFCSALCYSHLFILDTDILKATAPYVRTQHDWENAVMSDCQEGLHRDHEGGNEACLSH